MDPECKILFILERSRAREARYFRREEEIEKTHRDIEKHLDDCDNPNC